MSLDLLDASQPSGIWEEGIRLFYRFPSAAYDENGNTIDGDIDDYGNFLVLDRRQCVLEDGGLSKQCIYIG